MKTYEEYCRDKNVKRPYPEYYDEYCRGFIEGITVQQPSPQSDVESKIKYSANFLWGYDDNSIESLGYEFANAKTEEYQKEIWEEILKALSTKARFTESDMINAWQGGYTHLFSMERRGISDCKNSEDWLQQYREQQKGKL